MLRLALHAERLIDRWRRPPRDPPVIDPYLGYASPDSLVVRGRVLTALRRTAPDPEHGRLVNVRQMLSLFFTREVADVPVVSLSDDRRRAESDDEGYFRLELPRAAEPSGWHSVVIEIPGRHDTRVQAPVLIPRDDARFAIVSDIDDTLLKTGAYSLPRNLWTSLTGNALTRTVFPDAVELLKRLHEEGRNPVYYVSSSPWNLHAFLERVFSENGLIRGPIELRDFGLSENKFIKSGHDHHKGDALDRLMVAHPGLRFVLIGDTGQQDPDVYAQVAARWPGRVAQVILREPRRRRSNATRRALTRLDALNVSTHIGSDFESALH